MTWDRRLAFYPADTSDGWVTAHGARFTGHGVSLVVHDGFRTDFASIPRVLRGVISVNGKHRMAALIHDYLYVYEVGVSVTRAEADRVFLQEMHALGVKRIKRYAMYYAVRLFGRIPIH